MSNGCLLPSWGDPRWQVAASTPYGYALLTRMLLEAPTAEALATAKEIDGDDWIDCDAGLVVVRRFDGQGRSWELAVKGQPGLD
jgi:hypothetical protein